MPIKNYTTKIDPNKTIGEITRMLANSGAERISIDYLDKEPFAIQFMLKINNSITIFQLPINPTGVLKTLERDKAQKQYLNIEHARKVAWRILQDWIEAQVAIVDAGQAELAEVFLPYLIGNNGNTLYNAIKSGENKHLNFLNEQNS